VPAADRPGPGLDTSVAQATAPDARVVYADSDPIVLAQAEAQRRYNERVSTPQTLRTHAQVSNVASDKPQA
jgi:hypothetical protein